MTTVKEVDDFYSEMYYKLLGYIINRKGGGDKTSLYPDEAYEVLHDTYAYHRTHPQHFNAQYIWNVLKQRRITQIRNRENYNSMKQDFFINYYNVFDSDEPVELGVSRLQVSGMLRHEIGQVANLKHRDFLKRHFIGNESFPKSNQSAHKAIFNFRKKMVALYGED